MSSRHLLAWLAALGAPLAAAEQRPPNIVVILADDMGYADIGAYGGSKVTTPNLDRLAAEGRRFTNFHVAQPICSASRVSLLTGCYANRIGLNGALMPAARHGLADEETTLAELLRQRGYATGMAGKCHLGHHAPFLPLHHGFDEYFGLPYSNDMWPRNPAVTPPFPPLPLIEFDHHWFPFPWVRISVGLSAPSTAVLFLLSGFALYLRTHSPLGRRAGWLAPRRVRWSRWPRSGCSC